MSEDKTKVTLEYLRELRTNKVEPLREKVSEMKTRAAQNYPESGGDSSQEINVPFGNGELLPAARELSAEVRGALSQFTTSITELETRLLDMSQGIRYSELLFDDLESDAELDAAQVNQIISGNAPSDSGGPSSSADPEDSTGS
ncbi:hypothetical protein [Nocardiopsis xinjiangensis]|uniref:hypothetical protein n=1 Tax=Nocardiopsis xinjiangensis TaxID=124285 RepID=UPI0003640CBC|nr:hypothetical protein [Nocardiopsis xinjiangensis]